VKFIATILLLILCCTGSAQTEAGSFTIRACVTDSLGKPLSGTTVRLRQGYTGRIFAYRNLGRDTCFQFRLSVPKGDSLVLLVSHPAMSLFSFLLNTSGDSSITLDNIILKPERGLLPNVTIQTPPVWVRGDTTFFSADHYREGDEKKLRELLMKMPDFSIDEQGNLLYKKRRIEKLMLEGESLFGEKVKMLINSIPVHAIQTVQVLDNQNHNRLLKGLQNDNSIFLNIGLKKNRVSAGFGDLELGLGSANMYQLAPSYFLLGKKLKIGYAGNNNNTGAGFDWGEETEMRPANLRDGSQGMMSEQMLQLVNNFTSRRYVNNQRFSNHIQFNYPISSKLKANTQVEQLAERQKQSTRFESNVLTDTGYIFRSEDRQNRHKPSHWRFAQNMEWAIAENKMLQADMLYYHYQGKGNQQMQIADQGGVYSAFNQLSSGTHYGELRLDYTHRVSDKLAYQAYFGWGLGRLRQESSARSETWNDQYNLGNPDLDVLHQPLEQDINSWRAGIQWTRKLRRPAWQHGLHFSRDYRQLQNPVEFRSSASSAVPIPFPMLSGKGNFPLTQVYGKSTMNRSFLRKSLGLALEYGWAWQKMDEAVRPRVLSFPIGRLEASLRSPVSAAWTYNIKIHFQQKPFEWFQLTQNIFPQSATSFYTNQSRGKPRQNAGFNGSLIRRLGRITRKGHSAIMFSSYYTLDFRSRVFASNLQAIWQLTTDSLVSRTTGNWSNSIGFSTKKTDLGLDIQASIGHSLMQSLTIIQDKVQPFRSNWWHGMLIVKKSWAKVASTELRFLENLYTIPSLGGSKPGLRQKTGSRRFVLNQEFLGLKNNRFRASAEWYSNSSAGNSWRNLLFIDMEWRHQFGKSPWSASVVLNNILNKSDYYSLQNSPVRQDFFQLPLIRRNLFIAVRYEL
jgi:hypothetical protein